MPSFGASRYLLNSDSLNRKIRKYLRRSDILDYDNDNDGNGEQGNP